MTRIKDELALAARCQWRYSLFSRLIPEAQQSIRLIQDMVNCSKKSKYHIDHCMNYKIGVEIQDKDFAEMDERMLTAKLNLTKQQQIVMPQSLPPSIVLNSGPVTMEESKSLKADSSEGSKQNKDSRDAKSRDKGFKPKTSFKWDTIGAEEVFDLEVNDIKIVKAFSKEKLYRTKPQTSALEKESISKIFTKYAFSNDLRKDYWKARIGNRLRITKKLYESLVDRVNTESISRKSEKVIIDDLDRTFPLCSDHNEGKAMYQNMKLILCCFEVSFLLNFSFIDLISDTCRE